LARYNGTVFNQGVGAEMIAAKWGLTRAAIDAFGLESHARAAAAQDAGLFEAEIAPVALEDGTVVALDEGIRRGGTPEGMAGLKTPFQEDGVISAGTSSQISDGAAALLMTTSEKAAELGLTPIARVHTTVVAGDDPVIMLTGPIPATQKALARSGLAIGDFGAYEVNEAFASVPMAWLAETGADPARLNPQGGAIALGHPLGASGARLTTTLLHRMRREGLRYGLQTMCEGGGMANATVFELV
jgi:acetyl-CoA acyltransferase